MLVERKVFNFFTETKRQGCHKNNNRTSEKREINAVVSIIL